MLTEILNKIGNTEVILASASPRRSELLGGVGMPFKVIPSQFPEETVTHSNPIELVQEISKQKGLEVAKSHPESLVISADTIVALDGQVFGKPKDSSDAQKMLSLLRGSMHNVHSAFSLFHLKANKQYVTVCTTQVFMRPYSTQEINAYVNSGEPMGKAGAYAIQGMGALLVEKINGSYSNVVGLPLAQFFVSLNNFLNQ